MNKILKIATVTATAVVLSVTTFTSDQSKKSIRKNGFKISNMKVGLSKAFAAGSAGTHHQLIYDQAKKEVNTEIGSLITEVNKLLSSAKITTCTDVPVPSGTPFFPSSDYDLYSSAVAGRTFPISSVPGVVYSKKLELKKAGTATTVGVLYADCDTGAMEVRYQGKIDGEDTNIIIAYHEDDSTGRQSILMVSDYNAGTGYAAAKLAIHYIEGAGTQALTYGYAEAASGYRGTLTADNAGTVTAATEADVNGNAAATDLNSMVGISSYTIVGIRGFNFSF